VSKVELTIQYNEGTTSVPAQVPVSNSSTPGAFGHESGIGIDERDPLGLGEIRLADLDATPVHAVTPGEPVAPVIPLRPAHPDMPTAPAASAVALTQPVTESAPQPPADVLDLASIADMARRVEDARFAAERRLHEAARTKPAAPQSAHASSSIDPVVRRMAAEAKAAPVVPIDVAPPIPTQQAQVPVQATAPAPGERRAPARGTSSVSEATAALRDLLADDANVAKAPAAAGAPTPEPEPTAPPRPAPIRAQAEPVRAEGFTDTASLLRELASLSGDDEPARPAPTGSGPRPAIRTSSQSKRKGLFTR